MNSRYNLPVHVSTLVQGGYIDICKIYYVLKIKWSVSVSCIACFKCVSVAGDNPSCEDKFHNNATEGMVELVSPCMGGRKGRDGLFPASDCIKVTGVYGE